MKSGRAAPSDGDVVVTRANGVVYLGMRRPEVRNALSVGSFEVMSDTLERISPPDDRCVVIRSETPGMFCAGFDTRGARSEDLAGGEATQAAGRFFERLSGLSIPSIGAVDGPARGAGCELALRCDLRLASVRATFGIPAIRLGLPYPATSLSYLAKVLGVSQAKWLLLSGEIFDANDALRIGLVHRVVDQTVFHDEVARLAEDLASAAPLVVAYVNEVFAGAARTESITPAAKKRIETARKLVNSSDDLVEAVAALREKRPPRFSGM